MRLTSAMVPLMVSAVVVSACGGSAPPPPPIVVGGSSTVYPLMQQAAEDFQKRFAKSQQFQIGFTSTGVGLQQLCKGELDIADASRPITEAEAAQCAAAGIEFLEVPIAYDAITVVVHPSNTFATSMTTAELKMLWEPSAEGRVRRWNQIRSDWPDREIHLVGPDTESGTYDYFTEAIVGTAKSSRGDYNQNTDDEALAAAVAGDPDALGFFGYTYFAEHQNTLKAVAIDDLDEMVGPGAVEPSPLNVRRGVYRPLSRTLFLYVKASSFERPEVKNFMTFYTQNAESVATQVGGVSLGLRVSSLVSDRLASGVRGSLFVPSPAAGDSLEKMLAAPDRRFCRGVCWRRRLRHGRHMPVTHHDGQPLVDGRVARVGRRVRGGAHPAPRPSSVVA